MKLDFQSSNKNYPYELKTIGENKEVTVRDAAKKIIWSGPWDTEQDKAAVPDDIRRRTEQLTVNNPGV